MRWRNFIIYYLTLIPPRRSSFWKYNYVFKMKVKLEGLEGQPIRLQKKAILFFMREELVADGDKIIVLFLKERERHQEKGTRKTQSIWIHQENTRRSIIPPGPGKVVCIAGMQMCLHHSLQVLIKFTVFIGGLVVVEFCVKSNGPCFLFGQNRTAWWQRQRSWEAQEAESSTN